MVNIMSGWSILLIISVSIIRYTQFDRDDDDLMAACLNNIEMSSYRYRNSHYENKTVSRPSYSHNWSPMYTWIDGLYIEMGNRIPLTKFS